ncbi:hypothetical protein S245_016386 [Arachis hypogaea]|nr:uncharacterized protein DS421_5g148440 [Arachis hypogaea]
MRPTSSFMHGSMTHTVLKRMVMIAVLGLKETQTKKIHLSLVIYYFGFGSLPSHQLYNSKSESSKTYILCNPSQANPINQNFFQSHFHTHTSLFFNQFVGKEQLTDSA